MAVLGHGGVDWVRRQILCGARMPWRVLPASLLNLHCLDQEGICRRRGLGASATWANAPLSLMEKRSEKQILQFRLVISQFLRCAVESQLSQLQRIDPAANPKDFTNLLFDNKDAHAGVSVDLRNLHVVLCAGVESPRSPGSP